MTHMEEIDRNRLPMWVVYDHPSDYPNKFVARLWYSLPQPVGTPVMIEGNTLEEVRNQLPPEYEMMLPSEEDDKVIVEVWL